MEFPPVTLTEASSPSPLQSLLFDLSHKHDEDIQSIQNQLTNHSLQLNSIHELLLSMRPLKSDPPINEWSSSPPPTQTTSLHHQPAPTLAQTPSMDRLPSVDVVMPLMKKASGPIPFAIKDGPLELNELRRSLQGAELQAFGFSKLHSPTPPSTQAQHHPREEGEADKRVDERTALLNSLDDKPPLGISFPDNHAPYSDGDISVGPGADLQSRVHRRDPHGFMGLLFLVKKVLWGGLLLPHQKNIWDVFICLLLLWVAFATPMIICFGLQAELWQGHTLGCRSL